MKNDGSLFIVSSFSMDKRFMNTVLIPYLKETSLEFEASEDAPFMYVKVKHKKSPLDKKTSSCKVF